MSEYLPLKIADLKTGYVMAWENDGSKWGNLIRKHQVSRGIPAPYSDFMHTDVLGRRDTIVQIQPPKAKLCKILDTYKKGRRCIMLRYTALDFEQRRRDVAWWAASLNGRPYDLLGIAKFKIPFMWHEKNGFFCSEGVLWAYRQEYPDLLPRINAHDFMPGQFFLTNGVFEEVGRFYVE